MLETICGRGYVFDWNAASAIATWLAIVAALSVPFVQQVILSRQKSAADKVELDKMVALMMILITKDRAQLTALEQFAPMMQRNHLVKSQVEQMRIKGLKMYEPFVAKAELFPANIRIHLLHLYAFGTHHNEDLQQYLIPIGDSFYFDLRDAEQTFMSTIQRCRVATDEINNWISLRVFKKEAEPIKDRDGRAVVLGREYIE